MAHERDVEVLRSLAWQYREAAGRPVQEDRRELWRAHLSLERTRPPVLVTYGWWNFWVRQTFGDHALLCADPFYREHERALRMLLFHDTIGDDFILEPWLNLRAAVVANPGGLWGVREGHGGGEEAEAVGGTWAFEPPLKEWRDVQKLIRPRHAIDEQKTADNLGRLHDAIGDIIEINVDRTPLVFSFDGDISTHLAQLRGLQQIMYDMVDAPQQLHSLLAFMRDGILTGQAEGEQARDWTLANQKNQVMCYSRDLPQPRANAPAGRREMWYHCASQEFTLISPAMFDEFMLEYQIPIMEQFGPVLYGCCENLTAKIGLLRKIRNLRAIAVTPSADVARCAEQIGDDYVFSWRPNPAEMVCNGFDEERIRTVVGRALDETRGCYVHILLKDVESVEGDLSRLPRWVSAVRRVAARA